MYKVMVTGHRPQKLPSKSHNAIKLALLERVQALSDQHDDLVLITGMALGVDTWFAEIGIKLGIPVHAYIPFKTQAKPWSKSNKLHYIELLRAADELIVIAKSFSRQAYLDRNFTMVQNSNECIAVWDGTPSGTGHAVGIANKLNVPVDKIDPRADIPEEDKLIQTYFIRPRNVDSNIIDPSWHGTCIHLAKYGCKLQYMNRPSNCRDLIPNIDNTKCHVIKSKSERVIE